MPPVSPGPAAPTMTPPRLLLVPGTGARARSRSFDRRVLVIGLIHLAGVILASACLVWWMAAQVRGDGLRGWPSEWVLLQLRGAPGSYYLLGVAIFGGLLHLIALRPGVDGSARDAWEADDGGGRRGRARNTVSSGTDFARVRRRSATTSSAARWASNFGPVWSAVVILLSTVILLLTIPAGASAVQGVLWAYTAIGTALNTWVSVRTFPFDPGR